MLRVILKGLIDFEEGLTGHRICGKYISFDWIGRIDFKNSIKWGMEICGRDASYALSFS